MSKLKSIMHNRTHGHLGETRRTCSDCVHVMPGMRGDEVTCEIYTFKHSIQCAQEEFPLSRLRERLRILPGHDPGAEGGIRAEVQGVLQAAQVSRGRNRVWPARDMLSAPNPVTGARKPLASPR